MLKEELSLYNILVTTAGRKMLRQNIFHNVSLFSWFTVNLLNHKSAERVIQEYVFFFYYKKRKIL